MVVFTCNNCGDSLQKPKVEKHYAFVCRSNKNLTCVDCLKDFRGEEYAAHIKCLTEDERYAAKGTFANGIVKKGEVKQESWVEMVNSILDKDQNLKPSCRNLLNTISGYSNIPRKKPKFINFIKSSSGGRVNMRDVEEVWNIIEKYKNENMRNSNSGNGNGKVIEQNEKDEEKDIKNKENVAKKRKNIEENDDSPKEKKHKKDQTSDEIITNEENASMQVPKDSPKRKKNKKEDSSDICQEDSVESTKFNFQEKILETVSAKGSISLKKLQKKVLNYYIKETGENEVTPKAIKKFKKKLKKVPGIEVSDEKVSLSEYH